MSPSPSQLAALLVATAAIADLADRLEPLEPHFQSEFLLDAADEHAAACDIRRLDRRIGVHAAAWASTYVHRFTDVRDVTAIHSLEEYLPPEIAWLQHGLLADAPGAVDGHHPLDVRLFRHTADPHRITIDQLTHAHPARAVGADGFAHNMLTAHLALGRELGEKFAGVRLLAPRAPGASRHYLTHTSWHPLGECRARITPEHTR